MAFEMIEPLPPAGPATLDYHRIQKTPCSPEQLMATFLTAAREAGGRDLTITAVADDDITGPHIDFHWQETT